MLMPAGLGVGVGVGMGESEGLALALAGAGAGGAGAGAGQGGQKDTTWTKLFVGGLPYHTTDKSLREHFAVFGEIEEAVVITDRQTSKSRGYGFVIMGDRGSAERACKDPNPIIDGRKANVNLAILGAKPRGNITQGFPFATGIRAASGYPATVLQSQYGLPPGYVYQNPGAYGVSAAALSGASSGGLVQLPQLQHAAAVAAASHFYEYQAAAAAQANAAYQPQYASAFESYPYASAAAAAANAGYMSPYAAYATLPGSGLPGAGGMLQGLPNYGQPALQEARMQ